MSIEIANPPGRSWPAQTDVAIVGAGPIGLELAARLSRAGVDHQIVEAGEIGGTIAWWAPGTTYFSSPERIELAGVPLVVRGQQKATREQYLDYLRQVAGAFGVRVRTFTRVVSASPEPGGFVLGLRRSTHAVGGPDEIAGRSNGGAHEHAHTFGAVGTLRCRRLVLAVGNMHRPRMVGVPGEDLPCVSHYLADPHRYTGRRVLIVGGKNSACEAAIRLYRAGAHVTVSYRRPEFDADRVKPWVLPELLWLIEKRRIGFLPETAPEQIEPGWVRLTQRSERSQEAHDADPGLRVEADDVLLLTGYVQDSTLFEQLGVERRGEERRPVFDPKTMRTNVPGVSIAGTACGGSQKRARYFIETCHVHVDRIAADLTGGTSEAGSIPTEAPDYGSMEES